MRMSEKNLLLCWSQGTEVKVMAAHSRPAFFFSSAFSRVRRLNPVRALADEREKFLASFMLGPEATQHGRRYCRGMLFLDAPHHHAQVPRFNHHSDALRFDDFLNRLGDLRGQALLNLEPSGKEFDQAREFTEADHFAVRNIGHVHLAEEGQHVMLAQAEHFYVLDDDHLVVGDGKKSALE